MARPTTAGRRQAGFAYLALLLLVAAMGAALAAAGTLWQTASQREKERQLLHVGNEFRRAITLYYASAPGEKKFPARLEDLLLDPRFPGTRRHLRRIHRDPMTNRAQWGLVMAPEGGIMGVYSLSQSAPLKRDNFAAAQQAFAGKGSYAEWRFVHVPPEAPPARAAASPPAKPGLSPK